MSQPDAGRFVEHDYDYAEVDFPGFLAETLRTIRRCKGTLILASFLGLVFGFLYTLPKPPVYRASAAIEVQAPNDDFLYSRDINPNSNTGNLFPDFDMATQVRVLSTSALADRTIQKLLADPSLRIQAPEDRMIAWRKALRLPPRSAVLPADVIRETASSLHVESSRGSRVIEIRCDSPDPHLAALFLNTLAQEYVEQSIERRWKTAQHTSEWLGRQLDDIKIKLEKSEDRLGEYARSANLVFTGDKDHLTNVADEKLGDLEKELSAAQADRIIKQARYELVSSGRAESVAQVLDDSSLRAGEQHLGDLRRELAEAAQLYGPANVKVKRIQAQITQTDADQQKMKGKITERILNDFREAERREKLLSANYDAQSAVLSDQSGKLTHYNILKREVDINRQLYESLLQKVKESGISAALRASNIQVIDPAQPPPAPSGPDLRLASLFGLFLGLGGGIGFVSLRERLNRLILAPGDAGFHIGLPELGLIPSSSLWRKKLAALALPDGAAPDMTGDAPAETHTRRSASPTAEAFRALLTSILYIGRRRPCQVVVITSPGPGEGKTTVISNLAIAFAETGRSVLLIDCDTRKPRLDKLFEVSNESGLLDVLAQREPLDGIPFRYWKETRFRGVSILPSGSADDGSFSLLHSRALRELLAQARSQFDVVLIDTPPAMHLADARIVSSLADGVVLVVRSGVTSRDAAASVRTQLADDGIPVLGIVLNDWNPRAAGYYGYEIYAQHYASYGDGSN